VIEDWVYDSKSGKRLEMSIASAGLRKQLDRRIKDKYLGSGMFFRWQRDSPASVCEKTKRFR